MAWTVTPWRPGAGRGAEGAHGGGVAAALGGEVAAEAEHVCPAAQSDPAVYGAQVPAGPDEPDGVPVRVGVGLDVSRGDSSGADASDLGDLRGVLGQVASDVLLGQRLAGQASACDLDVDLRAPVQLPAGELVG